LAKDEKIAYKTINARAETVRGTGLTDGKPVALSTDDEGDVNSIAFIAVWFPNNSTRPERKQSHFVPSRFAFLFKRPEYCQRNQISRDFC